MYPNKHLTSGSHLQISLNTLQRPPASPRDGDSNGGAQRLASDPAKHEAHLHVPSQDAALEPADYSAANLSDQQIIVLRAIATGKSISAAAQEAGVSRPTIYRWQRDPHFQKWLAAWRDQTKDSGHNIMLTLIERSARIIERALDKDDASPEFHRRVRVAITLLTKLGVLAANNAPKGFPQIPGEDAINERALKSERVGSAGKVERR